ncbi:hypothetical protein Hanom_Chr06g00500991 [Helianthus anomalus]
MNIIFLNQQVASCSISSCLCLNSHIKFKISYIKMDLLPSLSSKHVDALLTIGDFEFLMVY